MGQFDGKVALVAGGNSGIGQASAQALAAEGAKVMVAGRNIQTGAETVEMIRQQGGVAEFVQVDVANSASVQNMVATTVQTFGQLNYYVHSAGAVHAVIPTADFPEDVWNEVVNVNLTGAFLCMKYTIPEILKSGGGAIVNVASVIGVIAFPGLPAYTATKAGMIALTKTAALEYAKTNLRINIVCPGSVRTPMFMAFSGGTKEAEDYMANTFHPMGRIGEPNELASAILFLCSDASSFITGHVMPVAGGWEVP